MITICKKIWRLDIEQKKTRVNDPVLTASLNGMSRGSE